MGIGDPRGVEGVGTVRGTSGGVSSVLGAGRECRYSGARRGIGGIMGHWGFLGGVGDAQGHFGGVRGLLVCRGCQGYIGGLQRL